MWGSWVKRRGITQVIYIAKLKDGPKRVNKLSQWVWKGFLKWYDEGGRKSHQKKYFWSWSVFLLSKNWLPLYLKRFLVLFFSFSFFLFFQYFSLFFLCPVSWGLGVLMIFEEKDHFFKKFFFQLAWHEMAWSWLWIYWRWMHIPKWSYARQYS
jgi:hypothetical protein